MQNARKKRCGIPHRKTTKKRGQLLALVAILMALALVAAPQQATAVNIVMNYNSGASDAPNADSDGARLTALMAYVEGYYQDIFEGSGTLTVNYYYEDLSGSTLAVHTNTGVDLLTGKPTSCTIRFDNAVTWFYDETPTNNSEFDMVQTLCGSLTSTQKSDYYNGSVPNYLEYSYKGNDNGTGPAESSNGYDLWSIALHEMGHGLGMTGEVAFFEAWFDEAYDIDNDLVWGYDMEVECYSSDDIYHIAPHTNMYPYSSVGQRVLPSATDIFSIETTADWGDTTIDLFRQDFYSSSGNADFNNRDNWEGHQVPGSADDVWIRHGNDATLSAGIRVNNLTVDGGSTVYTGAYRLYADQNCTLGNGTNYARVYIQNGGELQVDLTLTVANNAVVQMASGSLLDPDSLLVKTGGAITGAGTIDIEDSFINRGTITVSGGDLVINSAVNVNLDGEGGYDGDGAIYVTGGNFTCNKALTDTFSGHVQIDAGRTATFTEGWRIGGTLDLNGGTTSGTRAKVAGGLFRVVASVDVDNQCEFDCDTWFGATTVTLTDSADNIYFASGTETVIYDTATFTGAGRLYGLAGSTIILNDDAIIDVRFRAHGVLTVEEDGIGSATTNVAFALDDTSELLIEASDDGVCDFIDSNNSTTYFRGTLYLDFINGYSPEVGDSFTVVEYDIRNGTFASILCDDPNVTLSASYGASSLTLLVTSVGDASTAVPEPSTLMLLAGLLVFVFWKRKR